MNDPTKSRYRYLNIKSDVMFRRFVRAENKIEQATLKPITTDIPTHGTYGALLFRAEWRAKREEILQRDKSCVICGSTKNLQVHHRQYHFVVRENKLKLPWEYPPNLLITLCETCHKRGHNKYKVPIINI